MTTLSQTSINKYWQYALWLALFTIFYNLAEAVISIYFGAQDETLTLFGFGLDPLLEVMSGLGILAMVFRIRQNPDASRRLAGIRQILACHFEFVDLPPRPFSI